MTTEKRQSSLKKVTSISDGFLLVLAKKNHSIKMFTGNRRWIKHTNMQRFSLEAERLKVSKNSAFVAANSTESEPNYKLI